MKNKFNLKTSQRHIASSLLQTIYIIDILEEIADGDGKMTAMLNYIRKNVRFSFNETEKCRKLLQGIE